MQHKKQKELKTLSKRTTKIVALLCLTFLAGLLWLTFDAQLEHRDRHDAENSPALYKLEIKELEEVVNKDPNNYSAWKLLRGKYRQDKNYVKAKESWSRALEIAHSEDEVAWLKEQLGHIDKHHN